MARKKDLTGGAVFQTITVFALPMLAGNILQQLYNIVDTWVVGQFISSDALAAVGSIFTLMIFITSILLGLCMGSGVVFSHDCGRKDEKALVRRIGTAFLGIAAIAVLLMFLAYLSVGFVLDWLNIPGNIYHMALEYYTIVLSGIPAIFIYNFFGAYLKALGDSVRPLIFLALAALVNIVLDLYLVLHVGLGVEGTAWATVTAQYISALGCAADVLLRDSRVRRAFSKICIQIDDLKILLQYSFFTCLQQSVMNLGILMVQGMVNGFGTAVMAAFATGAKIDAFAYMPAQEYANAFSTFLAQNYGAGKLDRVRRGVRSGFWTSGIYCLLVSGVLWFLAEDLLRIFISSDEKDILAVGVRYLHVEGSFYIGIGVLFLLYGLYRAIGKPHMSLILTVISLGTRVVLAYIAANTLIGVEGIWWSIPIGWFLADLTGLLYYRKISS